MLFYDVIYFFLSKDTTRLLVRDGSTIETAQCTLLSLPLSSAGSLPSGLHADLNSGALHSLAAASQPCRRSIHRPERTHMRTCVSQCARTLSMYARALPFHSQVHLTKRKHLARAPSHPFHYPLVTGRNCKLSVKQCKEWRLQYVILNNSIKK